MIIFFIFPSRKKKIEIVKRIQQLSRVKTKKEIKQHSRDDALVITNTTTFYTTDIFARELEKKERPILQK